MSNERLKVGIAGIAGRGKAFISSLVAGGAQLQAVCDIDLGRMNALPGLEGVEKFTDYGRMITAGNLDAVIIATPQYQHASQALLALECDLHVLSEVPAAVTIDECRQLALAASRSRGIYMLAENYNYFKSTRLVAELVRKGCFGEVYYAEGEYLHNVRHLVERTPWRRRWQMGIDGNTYPTHELGPCLQWMPGDRVTRLTCQGSGSHYRDALGEPFHQDTSVMLCQTARGALIRIRLDLVSNRPESVRYALQGTDGVYEVETWGNGWNRIWLRSLSSQVRWMDVNSLCLLDDFAARYLPEAYRNPPPTALKAGHDGSDDYLIQDFLAAARGKIPNPLDIHSALDLTLPGLISQQSIQQGGAWLDVPDSRAWVGKSLPIPQLQMTLAEERRAGLSIPPLPAGYRLRQYQQPDEQEYYTLMARAGFEGWDARRMQKVMPTLLPGGFFVIEHLASGRIVATAQASHRPTDQHPFGGELGWVATDPDHRSLGLGKAVSAAATLRLVQAGYTEIYLLTDDFRLPAIRIYLDLGYRPLYHIAGMQERWEAIFRLIHS
ncbi:MAG TPA: GNAT family N-acetyltransferase [Anaerolineaceae bacterium]